MSETKRKLDEHLRRGRLKRFGYLAILAPGLLLLLWAMYPNTGATTEVQGEVLRLVGTPSEEGERLFLLVRLEDGKEVKSRVPNASLFRKGARVKLHRQEPRFVGAPVFRFRGYVDEDT